MTSKGQFILADGDSPLERLHLLLKLSVEFPQGTVLGPLFFLILISDIYRSFTTKFKVLKGGRNEEIKNYFNYFSPEYEETI